ncbi:MAG: hypothetical protein JNK14_05815 [Chitinophagaceae bacterium]|nr:hypothetical protein [Chitinophagaceae bacterium]
MSYNNPSILSISAPTGLDNAIESIRASLATISWLTKSFGRAWEFKEMRDDKTLTIPKVFQGTNTFKTGEYLNVLPNDYLQAQSFICCTGPEKWDTFNRFDGSMKSREIAIIFWVNLKLIDDTKNYIFTEELKADVETILSQHSSVMSIDEYYDEIAEDIFKGWSVDDVKNQYLMYPYAGMRFNLIISYPEVCS